MEYILMFITTVLFTVIITPFVVKVAKQLNIIDKPSQRRVHKQITARMGGLAIYISFTLGTLIFLNSDRQINSLLVGGFIIMLTGLYDDLTEMKASHKLVLQVIAACVVIFGGNIAIKEIILPGGFEINFGILSYLITLFWIVGITNAINLVDGLDGLAAGMSAIILGTLGTLSFIMFRTDITMISLLLAGACAGFLYYNFNPAKIFMGDTGALFLGFMIAVISIMGFKSSAFLTLGVPLLILSLPIIDVFLSIVRRRIKGVSFSTPDKEHMHHNLMYKMKLSHRNTVLVIYLMTFVFSLISYIYIFDRSDAFFVLIIVALIIEIFVEYTQMISPKYKPILGTIAKLKKVGIKNEENNL